MERVILVRHEADPEDDRVTAWLARSGIASEVVRPFRGEALPQMDASILGAVFYGGPFNVFEEAKHPFMYEENRLMEACLKAEVPLLGICQGAQTMAHVMGAKCGPLESGSHEFGYYEVVPTEAGRDVFRDGLHVVQAHFHGFDIPAGAQRLATSAAFPNQAMQAGKTAYAFQFHAEVTEPGFRRWQAAPWAAYGQPGAQTKDQQDALLPRHDPEMGTWFDGFLDGLFGDLKA